MEQWFIDIRQQETWDPVSSEKANKWMNHMITWREFPCSVQGCVCVCRGEGLKNSLVVSLNLEDTVKSLWQSQQLVLRTGRVLWRRELHTEKKLWRSTEGSLQVFNQVPIRIHMWWNCLRPEKGHWKGSGGAIIRDRNSSSPDQLKWKNLLVHEALNRELRKVLPWY